MQRCRGSALSSHLPTPDPPIPPFYTSPLLFVASLHRRYIFVLFGAFLIFPVLSTIQHLLYLLSFSYIQYTRNTVLCFFSTPFTHARSCVTLLHCASVAASRRRPQAPTQSPGPRCAKLSQTAAVGHTWWAPGAVTGQAHCIVSARSRGRGDTGQLWGVLLTSWSVSAVLLLLLLLAMLLAATTSTKERNDSTASLRARSSRPRSSMEEATAAWRCPVAEQGENLTGAMAGGVAHDRAVVGCMLLCTTRYMTATWAQASRTQSCICGGGSGGALNKGARGATNTTVCTCSMRLPRASCHSEALVGVGGAACMIAVAVDMALGAAAGAESKASGATTLPAASPTDVALAARWRLRGRCSSTSIWRAAAAEAGGRRPEAATAAVRLPRAGVRGTGACWCILCRRSE